MDRWIGKTAVVTGASCGIGAAICVALADAGVSVVGLARRAERITELQSKVRGNGKITPAKCDISKPEDVETTFKWINETFGCIHIMINNAGVFYNGGITDAGKNMLSEAEVIATIDINLTGTIMCARRAIASMMSNNFDGHIININSIAGHYVPFSPNFNVYTSSKYAVTAFCAGLLNELAHHNRKIKVTSVSPGLVRTELSGVSNESVDTNIPALMPEEVADAVLYVLSTPPNVNIDELKITSVTEKRL